MEERRECGGGGVEKEDRERGGEGRWSEGEGVEKLKTEG